jgi:hypothetical protein
MDSCKRTWNTHIRESWNVRIFYLLKSIDAHTDLYFKTGDQWHLVQADYLRCYVTKLKDWIKDHESRIIQAPEIPNSTD